VPSFRSLPAATAAEQPTAAAAGCKISLAAHAELVHSTATPECRTADIGNRLLLRPAPHLVLAASVCCVGSAVARTMGSLPWLPKSLLYVLLASNNGLPAFGITYTGSNRHFLLHIARVLMLFVALPQPSWVLSGLAGRGTLHICRLSTCQVADPAKLVFQSTHVL
jgi:hypothetical protein